MASGKVVSIDPLLDLITDIPHFFFRYEKAIVELRNEGCSEEDIIGLLQSFAEKEPEIAKAYGELAVTEAEMAAGEEGGRKDIGQAPNDDSEKKYLKLSDLSQFTNRVEDVVDTELGTLRNYILQNTSARKQYLNLQQFEEHVQQWSVGVWRERIPPEQRIMPSDEKQSANSQPKTEKSSKSKATSKKAKNPEEGTGSPSGKSKARASERTKKQFEFQDDGDQGAGAKAESKILVDDQKEANDP